MKKSKLLIFLLAAISSVSLAATATFTACTSDGESTQVSEETPDTGDESDDTSGDESDDTSGDESDDTSGDESDDTSGDESDDTSDDEDDDTSGDEAQGTYTVTFNTNGGSAIESVTVEEGSTVTQPDDPTNTSSEGIIFSGWYSDAALTTPFDFSTPITSDITLYAKWQQQVTTSVDFLELAAAVGSTSSNTTFNENYEYLGIFTFTGGRTEPSNECVNTQGNAIIITLTGEVNSITIYGRGASSSSASAALYDSDGNLIEGSETGTLANNQYFGAETIGDADAGQPIVIENLPAGTYTFSGSGSLRITQLSVTQLLDVGTPTQVVADSVTATGSEMLVGGTYDASGVTAQILYDNGMVSTKTIDPEDIDTSEVDVNNAGIYNVTFTYTENGVTVSGSYQVKVYAIESITLGEYVTSGATTTNLKKVYVDGETLSTDGLTVIATAKTGDDGEETEFILSDSYYNIALSDDGSSYIITVNSSYLLNSSASVTASYDIYHIDASDMLEAVENGVLTITVDASATVNATTYNTLTDALAAIEAAEISDDVIKKIVVADGEYYEKVYVNIPNVHLVAQNIVDIDDLDSETDSKVVFWFDALAGTTDPAGNSYGTNGSASFTIGSGATGFRAEGITFKNYYNTNDLYIESQSLTSNTQAVAVYIAAEEVAFYNCKFTSYHDTLYANSGSHYFEDCWIEGRTDFIFGNSAVSYYKNCSIWIIGANSSTNGGYVCATQNNDQTGVFVFDGCTFDGDENVVEGTVALGRPWGVNMKMVVMNSTLSAKFSTAQHTSGTTQGQRYVVMSGNEPNPANYIEYNNTGAGSLENLTAEEIAEYAQTTCTVVTDAADVAAYTVESLFSTGWYLNGIAQ